jgi:general secretion pathway protein M
MSDWWLTRSPRERMLLQVMIALAVFVLGWLLLVRPLADSLEAAKARHGAAVVALAEAKARDGARRSAGANAGAVPLPIDGLVGRSAGEAGFTAARITAAGPTRASVAIDSARPQALFGWVASLERRGLVVERLRAQANADRTLAAEIAFRAGGG